LSSSTAKNKVTLHIFSLVHGSTQTAILKCYVMCYQWSCLYVGCRSTNSL